MDSLAEEVVDAINDISRAARRAPAAHAKGTLLTRHVHGQRPSGLTTAAHMGTSTVPVTARFSNGGGDPGIPDYAKEGRGLAVKFYLPDGSKTDIVALSLPCFFVRTPEDFLEFTRLRKPDPETGQPDFEKLGEWMGEAPGGGARDPGGAGRGPAGELRDRGLQLDPLVQMDRAGRHRALGALPLRARGGRADAVGGGGRARGRDYLQEEIVARGRRPPSAWW